MWRRINAAPDTPSAALITTHRPAYRLVDMRPDNEVSDGTRRWSALPKCGAWYFGGEQNICGERQVMRTIYYQRTYVCPQAAQ